MDEVPTLPGDELEKKPKPPRVRAQVTGATFDAGFQLGMGIVAAQALAALVGGFILFTMSCCWSAVFPSTLRIP